MSVGIAFCAFANNDVCGGGTQVGNRMNTEHRSDQLPDTFDKERARFTLQCTPL